MKPKIIVYGVTNWDNKEESDFYSLIIKDWYKRTIKYISGLDKIFLTTGTYSPPEYNPIQCDLFQINFQRPINIKYSKQNCYFRIGFMTGIWKSLLDFSDFDILIHCQCRHYLGIDMMPYIIEFWNRPEQIMSINFHSKYCKGIDVGFIAMKQNAVKLYAASGLRQSCEQNSDCLNCEEEAFSLFENSWFNPWPNILSVKQFDIYCKYIKKEDSPYEIKDIEYYKKLPFIAVGKHACEEFYKEWEKEHPI